MSARTLLVPLLFAAVVGCAHARLGETMPELIARFGEPLSKSSFTLYVDGRQREVGQAYRFRADDWAIDTVMIEGICARIRYAKSDAWTPEQIAGVLDANAQVHPWTEQPPPPEGRAWLRADDATAVLHPTRGIVLELPVYKERTQSSNTTPPRRTRRS